MSNTYKLIIIAVLINIGFFALTTISSYLPIGLGTILSIVLLIAFFYLYFDYIIKIIYKLANIKNNENGKPKIDHNSAKIINKYWILWIISTMVTNVILTILFTRELPIIIGSLVFYSIGLLIILIAFMAHKNRIEGYTKEQLFK